MMSGERRASLARQAVKVLGFAVGATVALLGWMRGRSRPVTVFTLHRLQCKSGPSGEMYVSTEAMERWLRRLTQRWELLNAEQFCRCRREGLPTNIEKPLALVTVDDAFDDVFSGFFPLAERYETPFVLFVPTDFIDDPTQIPVSYQADPALHRPCSWDQLRRMQASGLVTLGAHSAAHREVDEQSDEMLLKDCVRANAAFEREGLESPTMYAYPRGTYSARAARILRQYYEFGFAGTPHDRLDGDLRDMAVPRVPLRGSDVGWSGWLKVSGWPSEEERIIDWAKRVRAKARRRG